MKLKTDKKVSSNCSLTESKCLINPYHMLFFSGLSNDLHFLSFREFRNRTLGTYCMTLLKVTSCVRNRKKMSFHSSATGIFVCTVVGS